MTDARSYPWRESAILLVAAAFGYVIKLPFGLLANRLFSHTTSGGFTTWGYATLALQLAAVVAGLAVYRRVRLPGAPWLERRLYGAGATEKRPIWRPALGGMALAMAITVAVAIASAKFGLTSKLGQQFHAPNLSQAMLVKLALLYPFAAVGASLSEEAVYRLGLVTVFVWFASSISLEWRGRDVLRLWIPIVLVGSLFGYVHVAENLETVQVGGPVISTLIAPQTWAGIVFGYIYCIYGFESAVICHLLSDFAAPVALSTVQYAVHLIH